MDEERSRRFQKALHRIRTEEKVELSFQFLSLEEARALAEAMGENPLLRTLAFKSMPLGPCKDGGGLPQVEALAAGLRGSSVTALGLRFTGLGDEGVRALAGALKESLVQSLDLGFNEISMEGARALAEALKSSKVTSLGIFHNILGDEGARAMSGFLKESLLQSLVLVNNQISVEGAHALAEGLKSSKVTSLNLSSNSIGDEGVRALSAVLKPSLVQSLDLRASHIREEGAKELLEGLRDSPVITLDLGGNHVSDETRKEIDAVLRSNKARSFILQTEVQQSESELHLKFRTLAGTEAAVLTWTLERPVQDMPNAVLISMRSSGFQPPFQGTIGATNLKLVLPNGKILEVGPTAAPLAQQLGMEAQPRSSEGAQELAARNAFP